MQCLTPEAIKEEETIPLADDDVVPHRNEFYLTELSHDSWVPVGFSSARFPLQIASNHLLSFWVEKGAVKVNYPIKIL